jgi:sugar-specific transcriptional regulator TrmB
MDINEKLQEAGLTGNEAKVYLELLRGGELSANQLAKNIGMDRTLTYTVLNHLIEKGQISYIVKGNKKMFSCSNPENLLNVIKAKEVLISDLIIELKKIKARKEEETEINVYEGKEGIRAFINLALKEKEFCAFGSTGRAFYALYEMPAIAKQVEKSNTKVRIIGNEKYKGTEPFAFKKFQYKYLDIESEATTSVFGNYISIHLIKGKPIIIILKNKDIANSYRNYFNYMWKRA